MTLTTASSGANVHHCERLVNEGFVSENQKACVPAISCSPSISYIHQCMHALNYTLCLSFRIIGTIPEFAV